MGTVIAIKYDEPAGCEQCHVVLLLQVEDATFPLASYELTGLDDVKAKYNDTGKISAHFRWVLSFGPARSNHAYCCSVKAGMVFFDPVRRVPCGSHAAA